MKIITKKQIMLPKRKPSSHKGENGKVLVIGGSKDYAGCLALAGIAALRTGADIVTIAAPEKVAWAVNCLSPDLITIKLRGDYIKNKHLKEIIKISEKYDAVLIGNGIGLKKETKIFVKKLVNELKKMKRLMVIDADGIKSIGIKDADNSIITPHKKELEIFLSNSDFNNINKIKPNKIQKKLKNNILLLKGPTDTIISKNKIFYNKTGNAGMTKAGTGDVLAGLCVGFLSQNKNLLQSAINAAYINGLIGDILLKKKKGYSFIASDMVLEIKRLIR